MELAECGVSLYNVTGRKRRLSLRQASRYSRRESLFSPTFAGQGAEMRHCYFYLSNLLLICSLKLFTFQVGGY